MMKDFQMRGHIASVPEVREQILSFVELNCELKSRDHSLLIALQEALANAVVHGCKNNGSLTVNCRVVCEGSSVSIIVQDAGGGFDVNSISDPTAEDALAQEHGRGIFLMRALMDGVQLEGGDADFK